MRIAVLAIVTAFFAISGYVVGLAQGLPDPEMAREYNELLGPKYERWNVFFGPLVGVDGDDKYTYFSPGVGIAYPRPQDGVIVKCHPQGDTQYCVLIGVRKRT